MSQPSLESSQAVEVPSRWDALFDSSFRASLERALPAYVYARRWYRTKTKRITATKILAAFPLGFGAPASHVTGGESGGGDESRDVARIALVELQLDDGSRDTYVVPLAFAEGEEAAALRSRRPHAVVVPVRVKRPRGGVVEGLVVDALALEEVLSALLATVTHGAVVEDAGFALRFHAMPAGAAVASEALSIPAKLVDREQTNSSILYGERFVGKIVRKLDAGESPDLEVGRFLTSEGFEHTPPLAGFVDLRRGSDPSEAPSTVGLLAAYVPNRGDAWQHALDVLEAWLDAASKRDGAAPKLPGDLLSRAWSSLPPDVRGAVGDYVDLAYLLGRRVGEMHAILASRPDIEAFAPEVLDASARGVIANAVHADLTRTLTALGAKAESLPTAARTALSELRARQRGLEGRIANVARHAEGAVKIRVHGDLHLGQVLFTGTDFQLIDFEGEPARPLEERRAKRSPLVDVAGMLRSYHYASVAALRARPEASRAALAPWASLWHRAVSASFLRGWLTAVEGTVVVPKDRAVTRALLDLYLLEKGIYEVGYEMNNRPDWVEIPLEGLRELTDVEPRIEEPSVPPPAPAAPPSPEHGRMSPVPDTLPSGVLPSSPVSVASVEPAAVDPSSPAVQAFLSGKATHAHELFGAHVRAEGVVDFVVWAPNATSVTVIGDFNSWAPEASPLAPVPGTGIFAGRLRGIKVGARYKYRVTGHSGTITDKADPYAREAETPPGTASVVTGPEHTWADDAWMTSRVERSRLDRPISIYEVHLGSWRRNVEENGRSLTYREIAEPLAAHASNLGFTHVELMPLLEHPFYGSWGYGVTGFFAATSRYGSPADLMYLVDTLHRKGLGVIFDWVPAHFARDEHGLAAWGGGATYEPSDPARAVHPTWNTGLFDFARPEVRSFLLSSATFWVERFHADGLRIDGVESILYRDHGRAAGTWSPNENGGRENLEGVSFLRELTSTLKLEQPGVLLSAEDSSSWPGVTRAASAGGLGFDLKWDMGFAHDMRRYLALDPIQRSAHQGMLTFRSVYGANESFVIPLSHDDVIEERGGSLLHQMHGDAWQKRAHLRLLYSLAFAQTGKKLLFMGDEFAQDRPWHHDRSLDWHLMGDSTHSGIERLVGDLNRLYRETRALHEGDASPNGFEWIDGSNAAMSVIAFLRHAAPGVGSKNDDNVVVIANFTPVPRPQYRVGVPRAGKWREIFNSDAKDYGGSGHGNMGGVEAVPYPWNGRDHSVVVTLPPLGIVFLASVK